MKWLSIKPEARLLAKIKSDETKKCNKLLGDLRVPLLLSRIVHIVRKR